MNRAYKVFDRFSRFWGEKMTEKYAERLVNELNAKNPDLKAYWVYSPARKGD